MDNHSKISNLKNIPKNGGRRPGSGRKMLPKNILKKAQIDAKVYQSEKSFEFVCAMRDNKTVPWGIRLAAAQDIQDRVYGKAKQAVDVTSNGRSLVQILAEVNAADAPQP